MTQICDDVRERGGVVEAGRDWVRRTCLLWGTLLVIGVFISAI